MHHLAKKLILVAALAAAGAAHAGTTPFSVTAGGPITVLPLRFTDGWGWPSANLAAVGHPSGTGSLAFSDLLLGALAIANVTVAPQGSSILTTSAEDNLSVSASIDAVAGSYDSDTQHVTFENVGTEGGVLLTAAKKNIATTGGSLSLTGIQVDLGTKSIYANLVGGNGVGMRSNQLIWTYRDITGATSVPLPDLAHEISTSNTLTKLTITTQAFDLFAQSLGLTSFGRTSMQAIDDYGVMTATTKLEVIAVPESSTILQMGIGLVGLAFAARRVKRA